MKKAIPLPSDKQIAERMVTTLESMANTLDNQAIFANISEKEREALHLSVDRAAACARNVKRSLRV